jgi:hypothetical protein
VGEVVVVTPTSTMQKFLMAFPFAKFLVIFREMFIG